MSRAIVDEEDSRSASDAANVMVKSSVEAATAPSAYLDPMARTQAVSMSERIGSMRAEATAGRAIATISLFSAAIRESGGAMGGDASELGSCPAGGEAICTMLAASLHPCSAHEDMGNCGIDVRTLSKTKACAAGKSSTMVRLDRMPPAHAEMELLGYLSDI